MQSKRWQRVCAVTKSKVITLSNIRFIVTADNIWLVREDIMGLFGYGSGDYYVSPDYKFVLDKEGKVISPVVGLVDHIELTEDIHGGAMQVHLINEAGIMQLEPSSWDCNGRSMDSFLKEKAIPRLHEHQKDFMEDKKMANELEVINEQEVLGKQFRIYGTVENPLFLAQDVAEWIDYSWKDARHSHRDVSKMLRSIDEDEKLGGTIFPPGQQTREYWFLTEDGLYEVLMQSRKPIAKQFKKKVKEILKEIRKTGQYVVKPMSELEILHRATAALMEQEKKIKAIQEAQAENDKKIDVVNSRIDSINRVNPKGTPRQKLVSMVNLYSAQAGVGYPGAWAALTRGYNTAYHCNLKSLITNYKKREGMTKKVTVPDFLEIIDRVDDAILVADKMLQMVKVTA